jgi:hypothetical protein
MTPPEAEAGITYAELGIMGLDRCRRTECKTLCPKCTPTRKNKRDRSLSVNVERGEWNCHNCHWHSGLGIEGRERNMVGTRTYSPRGGDSHAGDRRDEQTVQDRNPVSTPLSPAPSATPRELPPELHSWASAWLLDERGIPEPIAGKFSLRSKEYADKGTGESKQAICFPYFVDGEHVNTKYRTLPKQFSQESGTQRTLYNIDACAEAHTVVIVEGELDVLACAVAGWETAVSSPDGAGRAGKLSAAFDHEKSLAALSQARKLIIAVDGDEPGREYKDALVSRYGPERCWVAEWPEGCKDANEVLLQHGERGLDDVLGRAKPHPLPGVRPLSSHRDALYKIYEEGFSPGVSTGWPGFDELYRPIEGELVVVTGYPGHGKAVSLDTPIPTPTGWTTAGDVTAGDALLDEAGSPTTVLAVTPIMHNHECYLMTFDDGSEVVADADHQWFTWGERARRSERTARRNNRAIERPLAPHGSDQSHKRHRPSVVTTREIAESLVVDGKLNHAIQLAKPLHLPEVNLPIDPYWLGTWLGDGDSHAPTVTSEDAEIAQHWEREAAVRNLRFVPIFREGKCNRYTINSSGVPRRGGNPMLNDLKELGVVRNKHIPMSYLRASEGQRRDLLAGLLDTDGYAHPDGSVEFCTTKKVMADGVFELVCSLGYVPRVYEDRAKIDGRDCGPRYRVCFRGHGQLFRLERKQKNVKPSPSPRSQWRRVVSCDPVPSVPVRCLSVDSPNSLFLVGRSMIPTHNTSWLNHFLTNLAYLNDWNLALYSPENGEEGEVLGKFVQIVEDAPYLPSADKRLSREKLDRGINWVGEHMWEVYSEESDGGGFASLTVPAILDLTEPLALKRNVKALVIDPWNECESARPRHMSVEEYISTSLSTVRRWNKRNRTSTFVVIHPRKPDSIKTAEDTAPEPYEAAGAAHWYNKADVFLAIHRVKFGADAGKTTVHVKKHRREGISGMIGSNRFYESGTIIPAEIGMNPYTDIDSTLFVPTTEEVVAVGQMDFANVPF